MTDSSMELRATSDSLLRDLEALFELEQEKRSVAPSDDRVSDLASRIHEIAIRVLGATGKQQSLIETVAESAAPDVPIEQVKRSPSAILSEWRDVEHRLQAAAPDSAERSELEILAERIRDEYRLAYDEAAGRGSAGRRDSEL